MGTLHSFAFSRWLKVIPLALTIGMVGSAQASILKDEKGLDWVSKRDLTSAQFSSNFSNYSRNGYMLIDIDAYKTDKGLRYSQVWRENTDGRDWAEHRDLTSDEYASLWEEYKARDYRPLDIERYDLNGQERWAGIWVENIEGIRWSSHRNVSDKSQGELFDERSKAGYRIIDIESYPTNKGQQYASIWYFNNDGRKWAQLRDMDRDTYQTEVNQRSEDGYSVVDYESYYTSKGIRYAAIWEKKPDFAWQTRTNRTVQAYSNLWYQYADEGYRLIDFERIETEEGPMLSGIWAENASRYQNPNKNDIDQLINNYLSSNNLPGISVAVIENGSVIYRRGMGFADIAGNKTAHSKTVYNTASVSKIIAGTLFAKLQDEGALSNGVEFDEFNVTQPTSDYLDLPSHHTHNLDQLFAHLSCVGHYKEIPNTTTHYDTMTDALEYVKNTPLLNNCVPGTNWNYSTPAYTIAGAALEAITGTDSNKLLNEELFIPYGLSSMRVQYETASLPANSLRAVPYKPQFQVHTPNTTDWANPPHPVNNPNVESSYSDNSWKVLSGGIESNVLDLARFGWKVLNADLLSTNARDNILWAPVDGGNFGLGWQLTTAAGGENVAQWNGSWTGARAFLRAYQNDGLVVAIMSNRTFHRSDLNNGITDLADDIGDAVLN